MTVMHRRLPGRWRFAVVPAAALLAAAAATTPAAAQDAAPVPAPSGPATTPSPSGGGDACGATAPYGYIGNTGVTFSATSNGKSTVTYTTEFLIQPGDGSAPYDYTQTGYGGGLRRLQLPAADFTDGVTYTWQVRETASDGGVSDWSAGCHFIADHTRPAVPVVKSKVFAPSDGTTPAPPVRTTGAFTFKVSGPAAADAVRFEYALNGAVPSIGATSVPVGPHGTATVKLTPTQWGTNWLNVRTVDRAGNLSEDAQYTFMVSSAAEQDHFGDLNGDAQPDLLAIGADGKLYVLYGKGDGTLKKAVTYADSGSAWAPGAVLRNGDSDWDGYQDLLRVSDTGYMTAYSNNGLGDFDQSTQRLGKWTRADGTSWKGATQLLHGSGDGDLLTVENGRLLRWDPGFGSITPTVLATGLENRTVITPGDVTGDGIVDILFRDDVTGRITLAAGNADGTIAAPSAWKAFGRGFTAAAYPRILSAGDANGDGVADLYAADKRGTLKFFAGLRGGGFAPATGAHGALDWTTVVSAD
ncbi:FG-GAP repeat domain-containing protein [Streptomyces sp. RKAG337]|uniref:FG-GAP repeat domain-containing protein n=1 Tax=Streptomyces sp. RKAG337 TaxID=2893404 RepID=UPI002033A13D|nr:VCBS repeat-containing protein [Streptomyces sp. RKAG337]MCM2427325.1 VCBS repeat-containing protein [Streptomyces sp. RKAG337]